jgi:hypothetical protein
MDPEDNKDHWPHATVMLVEFKNQVEFESSLRGSRGFDARIRTNANWVRGVVGDPAY